MVGSPRACVGNDLAVQGAVDLVVVEPIAELFPGVEQHIMGDFDAVLSEDKQTLGAETVDDRIDVRRFSS